MKQNTVSRVSGRRFGRRMVSLVKFLTILFLSQLILSCGYFKIAVEKSNLNSLSQLDLNILTIDPQSSLVISEGSAITFKLTLSKTSVSNSLFNLFIENKEGKPSTQYFNLQQTSITILSGETTAFVTIPTFDDQTFFSPSQWQFKVESQNTKIQSSDIVEFTLIDNDPVPIPPLSKLKFNFGTIATSTETATTSLVLSDGKILVVGYSNASGNNDFTLIKYNSSGVVDSTFGINGRVTTDIIEGSNDLPTSLIVQKDGRIIVAGTSNANGNNNFAMVRYTPNGEIDPTFGSNGRVSTDILKASNDFAQGIKMLSSGKIVLGGYTNANGDNDFAVVRYYANGKIDTTFGQSGKIITNISGNDLAYDMKIQKDGKIVLAGSSFKYNSDFSIARYSPEGVLDTTFGINGVVLTDIGLASIDYIKSVELKADGSIVAFGSSNFFANADFALTQYTSSGILDTNFGVNGKSTFDILGSSFDTPSTFKVKSNGRILVGGTTDSLNGDFVLAEFSSNGLINSNYGDKGKVILDIGTNSKDFVSDLKISSDGSTYLIGSSDLSGSLDFITLKLSSTGVLDTSFGFMGKVNTDIGVGSSDILSDMKIQNDGKIILAGYSNVSKNGDYDFTITRLDSNGSIDTTFGHSGKVITDLINQGFSDQATSVDLQSDGKILVAGYSTNNNISFIALARYLSNGEIDSSFGINGIAMSHLNALSNDKLQSLKVLPDGKILVVGSTRSDINTDILIARFTGAGNLDATFGTNGIVTVDIANNSWDEANSLQVLSDGKILISGFSNSSGNHDFALIRLNPNGELDLSFGNGGKVISDYSGYEFSYTMSVLNDGKILLGGSTNISGNTDILLVQYNSSGDLDLSFGDKGYSQINFEPTSHESIDSMIVKANGSVLLSGYSSIKGKYSPILTQIQPNGALDLNFGLNGRAIIKISSKLMTDKNPIALQQDGKILFSSTSKEINFTSFDFYLTQFDSNGIEN